MHRTLRAAAIALVIIGALFKIQHWPWSGLMFLTSLLLGAISVVLRLAGPSPIDRKELVRDISMLLLVGYAVMRMMHLPYKDVVLWSGMGATFLWQWSARGNYLPAG